MRRFLWFISFVCATLADEERQLLFEPIIKAPIYTSVLNESNADILSEQNSKSLYRRGNCGIRAGYHDERIVGGKNADEGEFPWQVSLQLVTGLSLRHICGGAVVAPKWVITAGHCVSEILPSALSVVAGDHNLYVKEGFEQRRQVVQIFTNNFQLLTFTNDLAMLLLDKPFRMYEHFKVSPICLPESGDSFQGLATISGWGRLAENSVSPNILKKTAIPIMDINKCRRMYLAAGFGSFLHQCQICAGVSTGGRDACQGDSGGPLICKKDGEKYYLCGIISWGVGCARAEFPGMYTEVACHLPWIRSIMQSY